MLLLEEAAMNQVPCIPPWTDRDFDGMRVWFSEMFEIKGDEAYEAGLPVFRAVFGQFDA